MAIKIYHEQEVGHGLKKYDDNKLGFLPDNSGNVQFTISDAGVKGAVTIPAAPDFPVALAPNPTISGRVITFPKTDGSAAATVELPAVPVDVKLRGLEFTDTGKLKATLSDNSTTEVDFTAEVVIKALESAGQAQKNRLKALFLTFMKGEEVQNIAGETKGFLLPTA